MPIFRFLTLTAVLLATVSCSTAPRRINAKGEEVDERGNTMHLYRIDIDQEAVKGGARLLFAEPPPRHEQGHKRGAQGFFSVSDAGYCRVEVRCAEPVVGMRGQRSAQIYTLVKFFGRITEDGKRATTTAGERTNVRSSRGHDEVRFIERGDDKITIQAYLNDKPTAYRFHFNHASIGGKNIRVPWK